MKLEKLREIASKRTPGPWSVVGTDRDLVRTEIKKRSAGYGISCTPRDAEFIAATANHIDALLDVVGAAKDLGFEYNSDDIEDEHNDLHSLPFSKVVRLVDALKRMESIE